jgi:hypothetical protein
MATNLEKLRYVMADYNGETSAMDFFIGEVTMVNYGDVIAMIGAVRTAIEGITLGVMQQEQLLAVNTTLSGDSATDTAAQVELAWRVYYVDITPEIGVGVSNPEYGELRYRELPCADTSKLLAGSDLADPANVDVAAFITEFETSITSKTGQAIEVQYIQLVGRPY